MFRGSSPMTSLSLVIVVISFILVDVSVRVKADELSGSSSTPRACPPTCPWNFCDYGKSIDNNGCETCYCQMSPCQLKQCNSNETCNVLTAPDIGWYAICVAVTPTVPCPSVNCGQASCRFGFKYDSQGCKTCNCYNPCEGYPCPTNQVCQMTPDDCPPGAECRDGPMRICVDISISSSTTMSTTSTAMLGNQGSTTQTTTTMSTTTTTTTMPSTPSTTTTTTTMPSTTTTTTTPSTQTTSALSLLSTSESTLSTTTSTSAMSSTTSVKSVDVCSLPKITGRCRAAFQKYFYNITSRTCESFIYGGCDSNGNNFETVEECQALCGSVTAAPNQNFCPEVMCYSSNCQMVKNENGCNVCNCTETCDTHQCNVGEKCKMILMNCSTSSSGTCPQVPICINDPNSGNVCPNMCPGMSCPFGRVVGPDGCDECNCNFPCRFVTCPSGTSCVEVINNNTRKYEAQCSELKTTPTSGPLPSSCSLPSDNGTRCWLSPMMRWFYDYTTSQCRNFSYGGCNGNMNNFDTIEMCQSACSMQVGCPDLGCSSSANCTFGMKMDSKGCHMCECLDPCENTQCPTNQVCQMKKLACPADIFCPASYTKSCSCLTPMCSNGCQYGKIKDENGCQTCKCVDPCQSLSCPAMQICSVVTDQNCTASGVCQPIYRGVCSGLYNIKFKF